MAAQSLPNRRIVKDAGSSAFAHLRYQPEADGSNAKTEACIVPIPAQTQLKVSHVALMLHYAMLWSLKNHPIRLNILPRNCFVSLFQLAQTCAPRVSQHGFPHWITNRNESEASKCKTEVRSKLL